MADALQPMRIALFSGNYNYVREGANQALNRLVRYLERSGHQVRVYSPVTDAPAFEPAGTLIAVPSVTLPVRNEFQLALGLPRAIRRDIASFAPDLVHVSTPDILCTRAQTFAIRMGLPVVASLHTLFETYPAYYGFGWIRPAIEMHLRRFYRRSDMVLVPTPGLAEEMMTTRGDDRVRVWSRGIDRDQFNSTRRDPAWRREQGWADDDIVILFLGRLVAEKGVGHYVATVKRLQGAGHRVRALVVGAGPAAPAFEPVAGAVLTGHLEGIDLARAVASADIMLTPSTTETFGNVVLEAMASGLAIVSADAPSARALLRDGVTGLLCPAANADGYVAAVTALLTSSTRRYDLGMAARAASESYSWDSASRSVEQAYVDTLAAVRPLRWPISTD
jgi:glycosyltransferase involved in cell wall biosynthesis